MKANPSCNLQIDYSGMTGERRLPFVISLNLEDSILRLQKMNIRNFVMILSALEMTNRKMRI